MKEHWKATAEYADGTTRVRTFTYAAGGNYYRELSERGLCERMMFLHPGGKIKRVVVEHVKE